MAATKTPQRYFGDRLRRFRQRHEHPIRKVADALDVSAVYVSDVERGRRHPLNFRAIEKFASLCGLSEAEAMELCNAATAVRGYITIETKDPGTRGILLRLYRTIEANNGELGADAIKGIDKVLDGLGSS
jgi:transcriptional regulator with XRE-family HTH domain